MLYLSGRVPQTWTDPSIGQLRTQAAGNRILPGLPWAADTGLFNATERAIWMQDPPARMARYIRWLERTTEEQRSRCLFATLPDVVGSAKATHALLDASDAMRLAIPGIRVALVIQSGERWHGVPWDDIDAVFVGGPDTWQHGVDCARLISEARSRNKWVHRGRVNGRARWQLCLDQAVDSADGNFLTKGWDTNLPLVRAWQQLRAAGAPPARVLHCDVCAANISRPGAAPRELWCSGLNVCQSCSEEGVDR